MIYLHIVLALCIPFIIKYIIYECVIDTVTVYPFLPLCTNFFILGYHAVIFAVIIIEIHILQPIPSQG